MVIFRYQGPRGAPGMPEVCLVIQLIRFKGFRLLIGEFAVLSPLDVRWASYFFIRCSFDRLLDLINGIMRAGPTGALMGAGLGLTTCLITDGRFSGASRGFIIGATSRFDNADYSQWNQR